MGARISFFTSRRRWWEWPLDPDDRVKDGVDRDVGYTAGRAALLSPGDGTIAAVARGSRRANATDFEHRVTFDRVTQIRRVSTEDIVGSVRARSRPSAAAVFNSGFGLLSESASDDVRSWLQANEPDAARALEAIISSEPSWITDSPEVAAQYRMERDAFNVSLAIAGFDRVSLLGHQEPPLAPDHFLGDRVVQTKEDSIVIDDLDVFPGWEPLKRLRPAGRVFEDAASGRRLTVLHANKNDIETTTGVDLVYFVHDYRSFVLVQYKRVRREGRAKVVRLDAQLDREQERMAAVESAFRLPTERVAADLADHRLADAVCFFKLCETEQPAEASDLSRGKYVDLRTWNLMRLAGSMSGPRGGRALRYDGVARYLTNSTFAELVSEGWVGSSATAFEPMVDYLFDRGRNLAVALDRFDVGVRQ